MKKIESFIHLNPDFRNVLEGVWDYSLDDAIKNQRGGLLKIEQLKDSN